MKPTIASLQAQLSKLQAILSGLLKRKKLYNIAVAALGTDASPTNLAPKGLECAETVSNLLRRLDGKFPIVLGTASLLDILRHYPGVKEVTPLWPELGDIVLYATGEGNGVISNGHVFIADKDGTLMSNNSPTGTFERNYTLATARKRYMRWGGYPEHIFRIIT